MPVVIRLQRKGTTKRPTYRVVVTDSRKATDSNYLERVGSYYPLKKEGQVELDLERVDHWVQKGAQPSDTVKSLIRKSRRQK